MNFVIQNTRNGTYLDDKLQWRSDIANGMAFKSPGAAQNYVQHTYKPWLRKHPAAPSEKELEIVPLRAGPEKAALADDGAEDMSVSITSRVDAEKLKTQFRDLVEIYNSLLKYAEEEKTDVLHKIELEEKLNAPQRASLFKRLREVLIYRRQCKDMVAYLREYEKTGVLEAFSKLEEANETFARHLRERKYQPRILTELFEKEIGKEAEA